MHRDVINGSPHYKAAPPDSPAEASQALLQHRSVRIGTVRVSVLPGLTRTIIAGIPMSNTHLRHNGGYVYRRDRHEA